jgi:hypothetical protein
MRYSVTFHVQIDKISVEDAEHPEHLLMNRTVIYLVQVYEINLKERRITTCEVANIL